MNTMVVPGSLNSGSDGNAAAVLEDLPSGVGGGAAASPCEAVGGVCGPAAEWKAKFERLYEAHRKLQKTNNSLEDKLLRVVDKFEADKNQMTRDLASQTQRLVDCKLTIQRLLDQNRNLQSDLHLSINLLRNRPHSFVSQRIDSLPADVKASVKNYAAEKSKERSEGKKIRVAIPPEEGSSGFSADDDMISAAILAKVLEERDKERRRDRQFCIDVGTQTHGWQFPSGKSATTTNTSTNVSSTGIALGSSTASSTSAAPSSSTSSSASASPIATATSALASGPSGLGGASAIRLTSIIHSRPGSAAQFVDSAEARRCRLPVSLTMHSPLLPTAAAGLSELQTPPASAVAAKNLCRSVTCSALQTDI